MFVTSGPSLRAARGLRALGLGNKVQGRGVRLGLRVNWFRGWVFVGLGLDDGRTSVEMKEQVLVECS